MRSLLLVMFLSVMSICFMAAITSGLQAESGAYIDRAMTQLEASARADTQNALSTLGIANNVNATTLAALPTPAPISFCTAGSVGCSTSGTVAVTVEGASNGYASSDATTANSNANANQTLREVDVDVVWTLTLTSSGKTVATETARQTYAVTSAGAVPEGGQSNQVRGALAGGAAAQNYAGGCDNSGGTGCAPNALPSNADDTRLHVAATCPPTSDPSECSQAGSSIPSDAYGSTTWATTVH